MANLLTVAQIREHVQTGLGTDAVQRLIDAADAEIISRLGPLTTNTEVLTGGGKLLFLARKSSAIVSATERNVDVFGVAADTELVASDYSLLSDGMRVERLATGTNSSHYWAEQVTIVSTPVDETAKRKALEIKLVQLAARYEGVASEGIAGITVQNHDYQAQVDSLFISYRSGGGRMLIS